MIASRAVRTAALCGLLSSVLFVQSGGVLSYALYPSSWPAGAVPVSMILGVGSSWTDAAQEALDVWTTAGSRFEFRSRAISGTYPVSCSADAVDFRNVVVWGDDFCGDPWAPSTLAVTHTWYDPGGEILDTDVVFNTTRRWSVYRGPLQPDLEDFRRVAIHEFGHVLGLDHPDDHGQLVAAIMNSRVSDLDTIQEDDAAGVIAMYGSAGHDRAPAPPAPPGRTSPLTLDLTCHGYDEGPTRAYNCVPEPSQQHHMRTFVPAAGSVCDGGSVAEFPPGRIVFQIRCRDAGDGRSRSWSYSGRGSGTFELPDAVSRSWVRTAFSGDSTHFHVWCSGPDQEQLHVNELLGAAWDNDGTKGLYGLAACREVHVGAGGRDVRWSFVEEPAATALTPPRSWGRWSGNRTATGSPLPAAALQDLAAAVDLEQRSWISRPAGTKARRRVDAPGGVSAPDGAAKVRVGSRVGPAPDDRNPVRDARISAQTRTTPLTLDLTCHGYDEGPTRAYNCVPEPSQQHHMRTFVPAAGSVCDGGSVAEFPPGRIVFQIRCRDAGDGRSRSWSYSGSGSGSFAKPPGLPRVWIRTAFRGRTARFSVRCRAPHESLIVNELVGTAWGNDGTNGLYPMDGCRDVEVDAGVDALQWWFVDEPGGTALSPSRSWERMTGAGGQLPADALQDLAAATELERRWRRPDSPRAAQRPAVHAPGLRRHRRTRLGINRGAAARAAAPATRR